MTERIKELITATDAWCDQNFPPDWTERVDEFLPLWNEKFAELIILECASIDFRHKVGLSSDDDFEISKVIKEHFGVEE